VREAALSLERVGVALEPLREHPQMVIVFAAAHGPDAGEAARFLRPRAQRLGVLHLRNPPALVLLPEPATHNVASKREVIHGPRAGEKKPTEQTVNPHNDMHLSRELSSSPRDRAPANMKHNS